MEYGVGKEKGSASQVNRLTFLIMCANIVARLGKGFELEVVLGVFNKGCVPISSQIFEIGGGVWYKNRKSSGNPFI